LPTPTATVISVVSSTSSVSLFAANETDHGRTIFNDSTAVLYVKFGANASETSYTVQIAAGGYFEFPVGSNGLYTGQGPCIYSGEVDGIWAAANGNARLTSW
jgi:hypothetical protein